MIFGHWLTASLIVVLFVSAGWEIKQQTSRPNRRETGTLQQPGAIADRDAPEIGMVGVVVARDDAQLGFRAPGRVHRVAVGMGDLVHAGDPLVELETEEQAREVGTAQARAVAARAEQTAARVRLAEVTDRLKRAEQTAQYSAAEKLEVARWAVTTASAGMDQAAARVEEANQALQLVTLRAAGNTLRAPFDGTVTDVFVRRGARVMTDQPVLRMIGSGELSVRFAVPQAQMATVTRGSALMVELAPNSEPMRATVSRMTPGYDPTLRYRLAEARFEPSKGLGALTAGSPVTVTALKVPARAEAH